MREKLLTLLKEKGKINITDIKILMPEINGDYAIYMPVKEGYNKNILWINFVSQDFITLFNELLIVEEIIDWNPEQLMSFIFDGSPIYEMPICNIKRTKGKRTYWLPISISLKIK